MPCAKLPALPKLVFLQRSQPRVHSVAWRTQVVADLSTFVFTQHMVGGYISPLQSYF